MVKNSVITGTGSYIPDEVRTNQHFINTTFYTEKGELIDEPGEKVISKFNSITDIEERRYASEDMTCSTIGTFAAEKAIADAGIDPEQLDYIIVEYDHKYIKSNDPSIYPNFLSNEEGLQNINFYKNAKAVLCQSTYACEILYKNLLLNNINLS